MAHGQLNNHNFDDDLLFGNLDEDEEVESLESILEEDKEVHNNAPRKYLDVLNHPQDKMAEVVSSVPTSLRGSENVSLTDSVTPLET